MSAEAKRRTAEYKRRWNVAHKARMTEAEREKKREQSRRSKARHKERINATRRAQYAAKVAAGNMEAERKKRSESFRRRYAANKERIKARQRAWYIANSERVIAHTHQYWKKHRDTILAAQREQRKDSAKREKRYAATRKWAKLHAEQVAALHRSWREQHREQVKALGKIKEQKRRAARRGAPGAGIRHVDWNAIKEAYGHRCAYCAATDTKLTMDHVDPLSRGGAHDVTNVVPACSHCNTRKGSRSLLLWLGRSRSSAADVRGFL